MAELKPLDIIGIFIANMRVENNITAEDYNFMTEILSEAYKAVAEEREAGIKAMNEEFKNTDPDSYTGVIICTTLDRCEKAIRNRTP